MNGNNNNADSKQSKNNEPRLKTWLITGIVIVLILDYTTILRLEVFGEMRAGLTFFEALVEGNIYIAAIGILISIIGVAWIMYLIIGPKIDQTSR